MTFKHKLSCRLALLRNVLLLGAVCAVAACDLQQLLALLAPVASVAVAPATASVPVGQTVSLTATPKDSAGSALIGRLVTWASNAPAVATVDGNGVVTGMVAGPATITATSEGQSGSAAITVSAPVVVTNPAPVTDLAVSGVTTTALTLSFTEVNDGTGQPAKYDFRYAVGTIVFGSATDVAQGTCVRPFSASRRGPATKSNSFPIAAPWTPTPCSDRCRTSRAARRPPRRRRWRR